MKDPRPILIALFSALLMSCGSNDQEVADHMSFDKNPSALTAPEADRQIPSQGAPRPFEGQPQQPATEGMDCNYEVIRENFRSDPRFPEILEAVISFEEYQDNMNVDTLTEVVDRFNRIYADSARFHKPCSEDYLRFYRGKGKVEEYTNKMCEQVLLSQYFHAKFPCLRQLTPEQQTSLIIDQ